MIFTRRQPSPRLAPFVDCIWLVASRGVAPPPEPEIVLPDGKVELIVHFGDHFEKMERGKFVKQARTLLSGQLTEKIFLRGSGAVGMVAIRFKPGGSARFFGFAHHEISDHIVPLSDLMGPDSAILEDRVLSAESHLERMDIMENFLTERLSKRAYDDGLTLQACRYIMQSGGAYTVKDLVRLIGLSERQLERRFNHEVGVTPKVLARIARFQTFMALSHSGKIISLTEAALTCGYYDQAHFIRDFHSFAGVSPSKYLTQSHAISDFFTAPS